MQRKKKIKKQLFFGGIKMTDLSSGKKCPKCGGKIIIIKEKPQSWVACLQEVKKCENCGFKMK